MEACATGAVQVGTQIGGIPEIVQDGVTGLLIPPGDAAALARAWRGSSWIPVWFPHSARRRSRAVPFSMRSQRSNAWLICLAAARRPHYLYPDRPCFAAGRCKGRPTNPAAKFLRAFDDRVRLLWHEWVGTLPIRDVAPLCIFGDQIPAGAVARAALWQA